MNYFTKLLLPAGDWLSHFRKRLPLRACMTGKPKGRTVKALRERVEELCSKKETRSTETLLADYHRKVQTAVNWRGGQVVHALSDEQLKVELTDLLSEGTVMAADVCQHLVARKTNRLVSEKLWQEYCDVMVPFAKEDEDNNTEDTLTAFDPWSPCMRHLPRKSLWKCSAFVDSHFHENIAVWLYDGEARKQDIFKVSEFMLQAIDMSDPLMLDELSGCIREDTKVACEGMMALCSMPFSSEWSDSVKGISKDLLKPGTSTKSPLAIVATTIAAVPYYEGRRLKWLEALPTIVEKEHVMKTHEAALKDLQRDSAPASTEWSGRLRVMCDDLASILQMVDLSSLCELDARILAGASRHMDAVLETSKDTGLDERCSDEVQAFLSSGSIAFPLNTDFPRWMVEVAEVQHTVRSKHLHDQLVQVLEKDCPVEGGDDEVSLKAVIKIANACVGKRFDKKVDIQIQTHLRQYLAALANPKEMEEAALTFDAIEELKRLVSTATDVAEWTKAIAILKCSRAMEAYMKDGVIADSSKGAEFRKDVENLRCALAEQLNAGVLSQALVESTLESGKACYDKVSAIDKDMLKSRCDAAMEELREANAALAAMAGGHLSGCEHWRKEVPAGASMEVLMAAASNDKLQELDEEALMAKVDTASEAYKAHKDAHGLAGYSDEPEEWKATIGLQKRSALTMVEAGLAIMITDSSVVDTTTQRSKVQQLIKLLRARGLKEKELLHPAMYRWAYQKLTGR